MISLICARKNSKGLKKKNFQKINNESLFEIAAKQAIYLKKKNIITQAFVSTDSKYLASKAKKIGLIVPFIRPKSLSGDIVSDLDVWKHFLSYMNFKNNKNDLLILPCTAPLRNFNDIQRGIKKFMNNKFDGLVSITETNHNPYFNMVIKNFKNPTLINKIITNRINRRQEAPKVYNITTILYIAKFEYVMTTKNFYDGKIGYIEVPKNRSVDIDDYFDLKISRILKNDKNI